MADEIPENLDLRFLATQNVRILRELGGMRGDIAELQVGQAALSTDLKIVKEDVAVLKRDVSILKEDVAVLKDDVAVLKQDAADLKETGAIIESRLVRIEKQHGYVKA